MASASSLSYPAIISLTLLALQNGLQPILTKQYTAPGINRSTVILVQEVLKGAMAYALLYLTTSKKENFWKSTLTRLDTLKFLSTLSIDP
jgi:hypothetical protein